MNLASKKRIIEKNWENPEVLTNGVLKNYNVRTAYASCVWPNYLTLDLETSQQIGLIRFLLWDNLGKPSNKRSTRKYYYRLLISNDSKIWNVIYDTFKDGYNGWQEFIFEQEIECRYIRIHCLRNDANEAYHIIELQAFKEKHAPLDAEVIFSKSILATDSFDQEIDDGLPISNKLRATVLELREVSEKYNLFNDEKINDLIENLENKASDVAKIETSLQSIRNQIINPVNKELNYSNKIGKRSILLGIIGGIIGLCSIILFILEKIGCI